MARIRDDTLDARLGLTEAGRAVPVENDAALGAATSCEQCDTVRGLSARNASDSVLGPVRYVQNYTYRRGRWSGGT